MASINVQALDFDKVQLNLWHTVSGEVWQHTISLEYAEQLPKAKAEEVAKILPISKAIKLAKIHLFKTQPKFAKAHISSISLNQMLIPTHNNDRWYYNVLFMNMPSLTTEFPEHTSVVVLLNGDIVKSERVK